MDGWIKLHRKLLKSPIFLNPKLLKVFMWCLMKATHCEHETLVGRQNVKLEPGQFVFGRKAASEELSLPQTTVYEYMKILENSKTIVIKSGNKYSLVTVVNWAVYQSNDVNSDSKHDSRHDNKSAANRQQIDTNNNGNTVENDKNEIPYAQIVDHLNGRCQTSYRHATSKTRELIKARWNEGNRMDDFKAVIDKKAREWMGTEQAKYLRPETLFGTKFESYLNQKEIVNQEERGWKFVE